MEFLEAPAFTRYLPHYLDDEQYRRIQDALANSPDFGDLMPGLAVFVSCDGLTPGAARAVAEG